jgi:hypothetical protein
VLLSSQPQGGINGRIMVQARLNNNKKTKILFMKYLKEDKNKRRKSSLNPEPTFIIVAVSLDRQILAIA